MGRIIVALGCVMTVGLGAYGGALSARAASTPPGAETSGAHPHPSPGTAVADGLHPVMGIPQVPHIPEQRAMTPV